MGMTYIQLPGILCSSNIAVWIVEDLISVTFDHLCNKTFCNKLNNAR